MSNRHVDYYEILGITPNATQAEVRKAYKVQALKTHPDRVSVDHPDRPSRTRRFQLVNDAYYTLSDAARRQEYDAMRPYQQPGGGRADTGKPTAREWQDEQFGEFFEEMMNEEGMRNNVRQDGTGKFWSIVGALSGAVLGYLIYNTTGLLAGLVLGNRLGAIRDKKGKSVYEVFQEMPQGDKMKILSELAAKVLSGAMSS